MFSTTPPEPSHSYQHIYLHHNLCTGYHYSLILARAGNLARAGPLARAGQFFRAGRTFRATPLGLRELPELPSPASGNPLHDPLWSSPWYIRAHGLSTTQIGGYPHLQGRGYHSFPRSSGDINISHLGVSRGHRNVPHTSHCLFKATADSSGLYSTTRSPGLSPDNPTIQRSPIFLQNFVHHNVSDPNNKHLN